MLRHPRFDSVIALSREAHDFPMPANLVYETRWLWDCPPIAPDGMNGLELLEHVRRLRDGILQQILRWADGLGFPPREDVGGPLFERAMHMAAVDDE